MGTDLTLPFFRVYLHGVHSISVALQGWAFRPSLLRASSEGTGRTGHHDFLADPPTHDYPSGSVNHVRNSAANAAISAGLAGRFNVLSACLIEQVRGSRTRRSPCHVSFTRCW